MTSYGPRRSTASAYSEPSVRTSGSVTFDHTGADLIAKLLDEEASLEVERQGALYDGDNKKSLMAGDRIRRLAALRSTIPPVRVRSVESSSGREGARISGETDYADNSMGWGPPDADKPKKG